MKIIEPGKILEERRFKCINCGCIFDATNSEYEEEKDPDGSAIFFWRINCPCCSKSIVSYGYKQYD